MTSAIAESIKSRVPPRSSRRKTSQVNGMLMHMSMHSVSLEAILLKAKSLEGQQNRSSTSHLDKSRLQDDALRLLQDAAAMAKSNPEIMYSLAWENAMQRKLNAAVENANRMS
ncbi:hypothetical protein PR202_gb29695 [Eleusine coracana subsp. coracana]|uniref:Uncharacterized protein n=1 Tax=Eleusine coracana subsp. coracana TaxID=191504 RepID=A0AAV5G157_ELECO|nr:hypothetical protein PR202_gb29695 [Eleusine coracana subsp. coracana]